MSMLWVGYCT